VSSFWDPLCSTRYHTIGNDEGWVEFFQLFLEAEIVIVGSVKLSKQ
jgi:hypothetical protein